MSPAVLAVAVKEKLAYTRKLVIHVATIAGVLLALGLLPEPVAGYVSAGLVVLGSLGLYKAPNAADPKDTSHPFADELGHGEIAMSAGAPRGKHQA